LTYGIRDRPTSPRSPWQNPYAERLIGTLRRECLDHVLIFGERHLRRILALYSSYYNQTPTHLALGKDAPLRRAVQGSGTIIATPILFGLHHRYGYDFWEGQDCIDMHESDFSEATSDAFDRVLREMTRPKPTTKTPTK
jgi:Integrase core domain